MRENTARLVAVLAGVVVLSDTVVAHSEHSTHSGPPVLPIALFASSLLVLGTGLYLDRREDVEPKYADAGVFIGAGGFLVALTLFVF